MHREHNRPKRWNSAQVTGAHRRRVAPTDLPPPTDFTFTTVPIEAPGIAPNADASTPRIVWLGKPPAGVKSDREFGEAPFTNAAGVTPFINLPARPSSGASAPLVDWGAGLQQRGLGAEGPVMGAKYPGAVQFPRNFPGGDFTQGGTRTALSGIVKGKGGPAPLSADSFAVDGGTVIQLKTMKNSLPYYSEPDAILKELQKGMEKLSNIKPGTGRSELLGAQYRRVEVGTISKRILHVEMDEAPTPDQLAQLARLRQDGKSFGSFGPGEEIEVVVSWPGAAPKSFFRNIEIAPGSGTGAANLAIAVGTMYSRSEWREHQLETEGYSARGVAGHAPAGRGDQIDRARDIAAHAGSFARGDSADMSMGSPSASDFNLTVWQSRLRALASTKKLGEALTINWQVANKDHTATEDVAVVYDKLQDGTWRPTAPSGAPEGFKVPDINVLIKPDATNQDVELQLGIKGA